MRALVGVATLIVACGGSTSTGDGGTGGNDGSANPIPKVAIASAISGTPNATECRLATTSSIMSPPGMGVLGIGDTSSLTIQDGQAWLGGTVRVNCSIVPSGADFMLSGRAELMGVTQGKTGTFTVSGVFHTKSAMMDSPNIMATLTTANGALAGTCTGTFDGMDESGIPCKVGGSTCTQNNAMDVKPGAIWATVFCAMATDASQNPPRTCKTTATFRFENCKQM